MDILEYIEQHSSPESDALKQIVHSTHIEMINPRMMSGHIQGRVLSLLSQMIRPDRILELGTFTAYSTLCLAEGLTPTGQLFTIEHNDELEDLILRNLSLSPLADKIHLVIDDAIQWLAQHHPSQPYDLVFIDADKRQYTAYLDAVLPLVRPGGWILADNTLWDGHIIEEAYDKDKQTLALRAFNDRVAQDDTLEKVILPLRDGLTIIRKL
jgi:predicted O-methyltransferase YrrM